MLWPPTLWHLVLLSAFASMAIYLNWGRARDFCSVYHRRRWLVFLTTFLVAKGIDGKCLRNEGFSARSVLGSLGTTGNTSMTPYSQQRPPVAAILVRRLVLASPLNLQVPPINTRRIHLDQ